MEDFFCLAPIFFFFFSHSVLFALNRGHRRWFFHCIQNSSFSMPSCGCIGHHPSCFCCFFFSLLVARPCFSVVGDWKGQVGGGLCSGESPQCLCLFPSVQLKGCISSVQVVCLQYFESHLFTFLPAALPDRPGPASFYALQWSQAEG